MTFLPKVIDDKLVQSENELLPIVTTLSGIETVFKFLQPTNAELAIVVIVSGTAKEVNPVLPKPSNVVMFLERVTFVRLVQSLNALVPNVHTLSGKLIVLRLVQP